MRGLRHLRHGSKLLGIGMLGLVLQAGLGSGAVGAAPVGPLTVTINPNPVVALAPASPGISTVEFNVGITGATTSAVTYLDTLNNSGTCADSLNGTSQTPDTNGRLELNPVITGTGAGCAPGKYSIIAVDGSRVAIAEYEISPARG
jgi:hypothetical protein